MRHPFSSKQMIDILESITYANNLGTNSNNKAELNTNRLVESKCAIFPSSKQHE
jgi:hypothetical protein